MDIGRDIGHADEHAERVWKELDQIIQRRHDQRVKANGHRPSEEIYEASVRHHAAQRERERRAEWAAYHRPRLRGTARRSRTWSGFTKRPPQS